MSGCLLRIGGDAGSGFSAGFDQVPPVMYYGVYSVRWKYFALRCDSVALSRHQYKYPTERDARRR
jgi:hypothetical protein